MRAAPDALKLAAILIAVPWLREATAPVARGDAKTRTARELGEFAFKKFGKEAAEETAERLAARVAAAAARHGDDVLVAVRRVGPRALRFVEEAGEQGPAIAKVLAGHGDDAVWLLKRPAAMNLIAKHGDDVADALVKHKGIAESLIEVGGEPAARALKALSPREGRRLAMLVEGGEIAIDQAPGVLNAVAKHGDVAMDFLWRNRGAAAFATMLVAFAAEPEPFLDGAARVAGAAAEHVVGPVAGQVARAVDWTPVALAAVALPTLFLGLKTLARARAARTPPANRAP